MNGETVKLIENFSTWQGEGPDSGRTMILLRFKTCNFKCPWCDTAIKMRISAESHHFLSDIQKNIYKRRAGILITGGEPTVEKHFDECVKLLNELDYPLANVETNGYDIEKLLKSVRKEKNIKFIYSPKIFKNDDFKRETKKIEKLIYEPNVYYKIVWEKNTWLNMFCEWLSLKVKDTQAEDKVWLMPEGQNADRLVENARLDVFDECERLGFNFSSRQHVIYGFI